MFDKIKVYPLQIICSNHWTDAQTTIERKQDKAHINKNCVTYNLNHCILSDKQCFKVKGKNHPERWRLQVMWQTIDTVPAQTYTALQRGRHSCEAKRQGPAAQGV